MALMMVEESMMNNKAMAVSYQEARTMPCYDPCELHTTLPLRDLIALFELEVREILDYDSFEYELERSAIHIFRGTPRLHKCQYRVNTAGLDLGQLTLTRRRPFEDQEILIVERALGALIVHLKNAVEYQARLDDDALMVLKADALASNH